MIAIADIRRDLHDHPGVSGDEWYAHDLVVSQLQECRPDRLFPHAGGFGVIAAWGTDASLPTVAVRCDIDALSFGHRCGHDGHTAILLQLARLIARQPLPADRNTLLIFQPEEETGTGAQKILDSEILSQYNIRAVIGLHNLPGFPIGDIVLSRHSFAAASLGVVYRLSGRATHASTPEKGISPGPAVAHIIQRFGLLNSPPEAQGDDFRQATLVCVRVGEEAFGTAAGDAEVMFTLRAYSDGVLDSLLREANKIVGDTASQYRLIHSHQIRDPFRATRNDPQIVSHIETYCGRPCRHLHTPFRWSEDFAAYLAHYPGALFGIGAGENHVELHHPDYDFPDALIMPAAQTCYNILTAPVCPGGDTAGNTIL